MRNSNEIMLIDLLLDSGYKILRITENEVENIYSWWVINDFQPAGEVPEIIKHFVSGWDISDIFYKNFIGKNSMIDNLTNYIDNTKSTRMVFHHSFKYKLYSQV